MSGRGGRNPPRRPGRSLLGPEDRSLWDHVASSVDKKRRGKQRVPEVEAASEPGAAPPAPDARPSKSTRDARPDPAHATARHGLSPRPAEPPPPPSRGKAAAQLPGVDRRQARRIATGAIEIEARLDLHGMTQLEAHSRLIGFLRGAAARGMRTVLVITGKGGGRRQPPPGAAWWETDEVGILRRAVPRWLAEPPLRAVVIGCEPASPRHGGEGALYVLLRRRKTGGGI